MLTFLIAYDSVISIIIMGIREIHLKAVRYSDNGKVEYQDGIVKLFIFFLEGTVTNPAI